MLRAFRDLAGLPAANWVVFATFLVNRMGTMVLPFLVVYLTRRLGMSTTLAGAVLATYGGASIVAGPFIGRLADRIGPYHMMLASLSATAVVQLSFPFATSLPAVIAATIALALVSEGFRPAAMMVVGDVASPARRKAAFALNRLAANLGMAVGPVAGGFIAERSLTALFWIDAASTFCAAVVLIVAAGYFPRHTSRPPESESVWRGFGHVLVDRRMTTLLLALLPVAVVFFQHEATLPLYMVRDLGMPTSSFGLMFTVNTLLIVLFEVPLNAATGAWSHRRTLSLGSFFVSLGFASVAVAHTLPTLMGTVVLWTIGEMLLLPSLAAYIADIAPPARRGLYLGFYSTTFSVALALSPIAGTQGMAHLGATWTWLLCGVAGLASTIVFARLGASQRQGVAAEAQ